MDKKKIFLSVLTLLILLALPSGAKDKNQTGENLARNAGMTLLGSFSCDSVGKASQNVISSIESLKKTIGTIENVSAQCRTMAQQIAALPSIQDVMNSFNATATAQDIQKQRNILQEAAQDLAAVSELPTNDPRLQLYPSTLLIQQTVDAARARLYEDIGQNLVDEGEASRQRYLIGMRNLEQIGTTLGTYLKNDQGCFQNNAGMQRHLTAGILGVAGFFLDSPWGTGVELAGKLLQNIFSLAEAKHFHPDRDAFSATDQATLVAGMGCALEFLGKEHCQLVREDQVQRKAEGIEKCEKCDISETEVHTVSQKQKENVQAVNEIMAWTAKSQLSSASNPNDRQRKQRIASAYQNVRTAFDDQMIDLRKSLEGMTPEAKAKVQQDGMGNLLGILATLMGSTGSGTSSNNGVISAFVNGKSITLPPPELTAYLFSQKDKEYDFLKFLYSSTDEDQKVYGDLQNEYKKAVEGNANITVPTNAKAIFDFLIQRPLDSWGPRTREIVALLQSPKALDNIEAQVHLQDKKVASITQPEISNQKLGQLINDFYGDKMTTTSPYGSLLKIKESLSLLPEEFKAKYGKLTGLPDLEAAINHITTEAESLEKGKFESQALANQLIKDTQKIVGEENELFTQIDTTFKRARSYYIEKLKKYANDQGDATILANALFLMDQDVLDATSAFSFNPIAQKVDYAQAKSLSGSQLDAFSKYFSSYLAPAMNYLDGKDIKGKNLSPGLRDVLQDSSSGVLKSDFCMKLLAMTEIPDNVRKECERASLESNGNKILFKDYVDSKLNVRACVYQLFLHKENQKIREQIYK